jgi:serine/threonine protein kinase
MFLVLPVTVISPPVGGYVAHRPLTLAQAQPWAGDYRARPEGQPTAADRFSRVAPLPALVFGLTRVNTETTNFATLTNSLLKAIDSDSITRLPQKEESYQLLGHGVSGAVVRLPEQPKGDTAQAIPALCAKVSHTQAERDDPRINANHSVQVGASLQHEADILSYVSNTLKGSPHAAQVPAFKHYLAKPLPKKDSAQTENHLRDVLLTSVLSGRPARLYTPLYFPVSNAEELGKWLFSATRTDDTSNTLNPLFDLLLTLDKVGVLHGDLQPANIFIDHDSSDNVVPRLIDFGNARLFEPNDILKNPEACHMPTTCIPNNLISFENKWLGPWIAAMGCNQVPGERIKGYFEDYLRQKAIYLEKLVEHYRQQLKDSSIVFGNEAQGKQAQQTFEKALDYEAATAKMLKTGRPEVLFLEAARIQFYYAQTWGFRMERYGNNPAIADKWYILSAANLKELFTAALYYAYMTKADQAELPITKASRSEGTNGGLEYSKQDLHQYMSSLVNWSLFYREQFNRWYTKFRDDHSQPEHGTKYPMLFSQYKLTIGPLTLASLLKANHRQSLIKELGNLLRHQPIQQARRIGHTIKTAYQEAQDKIWLDELYFPVLLTTPWGYVFKDGVLQGDYPLSGPHMIVPLLLNGHYPNDATMQFQLNALDELRQRQEQQQEQVQKP